MSSTVSKPIYALLDCNNFYVSCERIFRPDLDDKPVAVLSNNDGCIIARSNELKDLGVEIGAPYHQYRHTILGLETTCFSSNYTLYGDISARVMSIIQGLIPQVEIYSIDEAFMRLDGLPDTPYTLAIELQKRIKQWVGIPVCVGIGPTKVLAKVANHKAKKDYRQGKSGVCDLSNESHYQSIIRNIAIEEIWGVGRGFSKRLKECGIYTAHDLAHASHSFLKRHFNVVVTRLSTELKGISCLSLEEIIPQQKSIMASRSFGKLVTEFDDLAEAISWHMARAAKKLRKKGLTTNHIGIFIRTNRFREHMPQYRNEAYFALPYATNHTDILTRFAKKMLLSIYRKGYAYHKCGVFCLELRSEKQLQYNLFHSYSQQHETKKKALESALDSLNKKYDRDVLFYGAEGIKKEWRMRRNIKSCRYTTKWNELFTIKP